MSPAPGPKRVRGRSAATSYDVVACVGCDSPYCHEQGREVRDRWNWLLSCAGPCGRRLCRICLPDGAERCLACGEAVGVVA